MKVSFLKVIFLLFFCLLSFAPFVASAGAEHNMSGFAWSSNIGWVSFNCTNTVSCGTSNYGVNKNNDGTLSGYAWSSDIGWVQFGGLSGFPSGTGTSPQNAQVVNGNLVGWAKALSAGGASTGWDGWISLSGSAYGVSFSDATKRFTGYAWGGSVVGWVNFNAAGSQSVVVGPAAPSGSISATDCTIAQDASTCSDTNVTWTTSNLTAGATEVTRNNPAGTSVSTATSGTNVDNPVTYGESTYYLYHNIDGTPTVLAETSITASCVLGTAWSDGPDPDLDPDRCLPIAISGFCDEEHYSCFQGNSINNAQTPTQYTWTCQGINGGTNASCSELKVCGDGVVDAALGEECDEGSGNSNFCPSTCSSTCQDINASNPCTERPLFIEE